MLHKGKIGVGRGDIISSSRPRGCSKAGTVPRKESTRENYVINFMLIAVPTKEVSTY
jgi:hypothetical protein